MQGDYGPFKANFPLKVPLWLAIYLYQRKQCRIQPPDWLRVEPLQGVYPPETLAKQSTSSNYGYAHIVKTMHWIATAAWTEYIVRLLLVHYSVLNHTKVDARLFHTRSAAALKRRGV